MARKQKTDPLTEYACQKRLKNIIWKLIKNSSIAAAELQLEYLRDHPDMQLPTFLNHKRTIREYELLIKEYKESLTNKL